MLRHYGDVLLTSPVFSALDQMMPGAQVDALVYKDTAAMLNGHPAISQIHCIDRQWKTKGLEGLKAERKLFHQLKSRQFDLVIHLCRHWRGWWMTAFLKPAESIAVTRPEWIWRRVFKRLYEDRLLGQHRVERNLAALYMLGLAAPADTFPLTLSVPADAQKRVAAAWQAYGINRDGYVLIHPVSRWLFKCWPAEKVAQLINRLTHNGLTVALSSGAEAKEQAFIGSIRDRLENPIIDLSGKLTLETLAAWIEGARLLVSVDSAPMHMAAALQVPTVALFGPSDETEWGPWQVPHRVVAASHYPCRPCAKDGCNGSKISQCLNDIEVDEVYIAIQDLLRSFSSSY